MDVIWIYLLSVILFAAGAVVSLLSRSSSTIRRWSGAFGFAGSLVGIAAAALALIRGSVPSAYLFYAPPFGSLSLEIDPLAAFLIGIIGLVGAAVSFYSISYLKTVQRPLNGMGFFTNLFLAAMMLVVAMSNAFYFLVFWELMTLASYFLVTFESERKEAVRAGYIYMLVAHAGAALILIAMLVLFQKTGSFEFSAFRSAELTPAVRSLVFLLALIGFGAKAGMVPLQFWMPAAYSEAPSHVSALMSGAMKKLAIYGFLRVSVDILGAEIGWWGGLVMSMGAVSAVLGVLYALSESDLKRMLAYSSVENVGIILIGVGAGMTGMAFDKPALAMVGFVAALYHMANHAFFKSLLFLGSGAVEAQTGEKNLNRLGGLSRRMPWTALAFLTGAMAVSAIPPLNGFVSEWFTYQALFAASEYPVSAIRSFGPIIAMFLGLTGALAVMCFIKAYGGVFTGPTRTPAAAEAHEAPAGMRASMLALALGCVLLGVGAPVVIPLLSGVSASLAAMPSMQMSSGFQVYPVDANQAVLSTPLVAVLLVSLLSAPIILVAAFGGRRARRRAGVDPWACGYGYKPVMSVTAGNFDLPVRSAFQLLYRLRTVLLEPWRRATGYSKRAVSSIQRAEPVVENVVSRPAIRFVETAGQWIQALQMGDIRVYCLYIIVTLAILLIVVFW